MLPLQSQIQKMTMDIDSISLLLDQLETSVFNNKQFADRKMLNSQIRGDILNKQIDDQSLKEKYSNATAWEGKSQ